MIMVGVEKDRSFQTSLVFEDQLLPLPFTMAWFGIHWTLWLFVVMILLGILVWMGIFCRRCICQRWYGLNYNDPGFKEDFKEGNGS